MDPKATDNWKNINDKSKDLETGSEPGETLQPEASENLPVKDRETELNPRDKQEREDEQKLLDKYFPEGGKPDYYGLMVELSRRSGREMSDRYREGADAAENLIYRLGYSAFERGNYDRLMAKIADLFISEKDSDWSSRGFQSWSHSLCHVFEHYGRGEEQADSLLCSASIQPSCTRLIDEAVARSVKNSSAGCMHRIVGPLLTYNIDQIVPDDLDGKWAYKPASLENEKFVRIINGDKEDSEMALFCTSTSPRPVLLALIKKYVDPNNKYKEYSALHALEPEKLAALLAKLVPGDISAEEADVVVRQRFEKEGLDRLTLMGNLAQVESAKELVDAVMVDVDGTLVLEEALSSNVLSLMEALAAAGRRVIVFTGGDPEKQTEKLVQLGLDAKFLPVQSKEKYRGKILETVIDDTLPQLQGFKTGNYYHGRAGWKKDWRDKYEINEAGRLLKKVPSRNDDY